MSPGPRQPMANDLLAALPENLVDVLALSADRYPTCRLHFPATQEVFPLSAILKESANYAAGLRAHGVVTGQPVGLILRPGPGFVLAFFGALRAGAVPTCLPHPRSAREIGDYALQLNKILTEGGISLLVVDPSWRSFLSKRIPSVTLCDLEALGSAGGPAPPHVVRAHDLALIQYTSGSTAAPKGVALTHANVVSGIHAIVSGMDARPDDVSMQWLPLFHDMGLFSLLSGIWVGATQYIYPPSVFLRDPAGWLAQFAKLRATVYAGPNFSYKYLLDYVTPEQVRALDLSAWRLAFNGSEPVDAVLVERCIELLGPAGFRPSAMFPVYGMAEATLAVSFPRLGDVPHVDWVDRQILATEGRVVRIPRNAPSARGVTSVGAPVRGICLRVVGPDKTEVASDLVGEIEIAGASVMAGYYNNPEATALSHHDGWVRTGDLGYLSDGQLFVIGRLKHMIIISGVNYYPEDAEAALDGLVGVRQGCCAALGICGERAEDDRLVVLVETSLEDLSSCCKLAEEVLMRVRTALGMDRIQVLCVRPQTISVTSSGKVQRNHMRDLLNSGGLDARVLSSAHGKAVNA